MSGGTKAGVAGGGLLIALGFGARGLDDCARMGMRGGAGLADDAGRAAMGTRMAVYGDDAARMGGRGIYETIPMGSHALDDAAIYGTRGAGSLEGMGASHADDVSWLGAVRDPAIDVAMEVVSDADDDDVSEPELVPAEVRRNSDGSLQTLPPGPPSRPPHTLVLAYDDFGPQALAGTLLGAAWWQWEAGGSWEPGDRFDVRVVVYRGPSEEEVAAEYPTVEGAADYRYVSYDEAMAFFDGALADTDGEPTLASLRAQLQATRKRIEAALRSSPRSASPSARRAPPAGSRHP